MKSGITAKEFTWHTLLSTQQSVLFDWASNGKTHIKCQNFIKALINESLYYHTP